MDSSASRFDLNPRPQREAEREPHFSGTERRSLLLGIAGRFLTSARICALWPPSQFSAGFRYRDDGQRLTAAVRMRLLRKHVMKAVDSVVKPLILDFIERLASRERMYDEVMEAWRISCPQLPVWGGGQQLRIGDDSCEGGTLCRCAHVIGPVFARTASGTSKTVAFQAVTVLR